MKDTIYYCINQCMNHNKNQYCFKFELCVLILLYKSMYESLQKPILFQIWIVCSWYYSINQCLNHYKNQYCFKFESLKSLVNNRNSTLIISVLMVVNNNLKLIVAKRIFIPRARSASTQQLTCNLAKWKIYFFFPWPVLWIALPGNIWLCVQSISHLAK